jgi:hypothetical protein
MMAVNEENWEGKGKEKLKAKLETKIKSKIKNLKIEIDF